MAFLAQFILNLSFKSFSFLPPPKKKIIIYDSNLSNYLTNFLGNDEYHILYSRGEKINFFILIKIIIKFKFTFLEYCNEYLRYVEPKFIITFTDNNKLFYLLKSNTAKKIFIQCAWRTKINDLPVAKTISNNYSVDYMLVFNNLIGKFYSYYIKGKYIAIGSFRSNSANVYKGKKKIDILYISTFRVISSDFLTRKNNKFEFFKKGEIDILKLLRKFSDDIKQKIYVYGAMQKKENQLKEYSFFKKILGDNFVFIKNNKNKTYYYTDCSKIVISSDSTLGYESLSRGNKTIIFNTRSSSKKEMISKKFGWPKKIPYNGLFWINSLDYKNFRKIFDRVFSMKKKQWISSVNLIMSDILKHYKNNYVFMSFLKKNKIIF
jgi:surface carbohydrate biosynthesis protein